MSNARKVYLDHNATTPLHPEVKTAMISAMEEFGNPSSLHEFGRRARKLVEDARHELASFIGADTDEVIFMGSGSEANNTVFNLFSCGGFNKCEVPGLDINKREVLTSKIEHPCVLESAACLAERGAGMHYIGVDRYGKVNMEEFNNCLSEKTALVSIMAANNEIGTFQDIKTLANIAHKKGAFFHTDAVQAVGKIPINVKELEVDFLSLSAHKIYGPKGVGALYIRKNVPFCPFVRGGHQERGRRAGTENTLGIVGLGKAIEMRRKEMADEHRRLIKLKELLKNGIEKSIAGAQFNGHPTDSLASTLNVSFAAVEGESILLYLDLEGIAVSTGSACASGSLDPSHVLLASGLSQEGAHGSIRMSMGRETKEEDIKYVIEKLTSVIKLVRGISTVTFGGGHGK